MGIALTAMLAFSACERQYCPESDFRVEPVEGGGSVRIVEYVGNNFEVRIPPRIGNMSVTHIGADAFSGRRVVDGEWVTGHRLAGITIPDSVIYIETNAFFYNRLTNVVIPDSVVYIGWEAFMGNALTNVAIGNNVETIEFRAFGFNNLTNLVIPDSVTDILCWAFASNQLASVTIGNNVEFIGSNTFAGNRLASITIPDSVGEIASMAFADNRLTSVTIPKGTRISTFFLDDGTWVGTFDQGVSVTRGEIAASARPDPD